MARVIDKDKLITSMAWHDQQGMISCIDDILDTIEAFPTLTQPNEPLTLEELRGMANKPYWHVGLREESAAPHWSILDPLLAYHPEDYDYGEGWLAYHRPPEGEA